MRTLNSDLRELQERLDSVLPDKLWLQILEVFVPTGVANSQHIRLSLGIQRDKFRRIMDKMEKACTGFEPVLVLSDKTIRKEGQRGRTPDVYLLGNAGAKLLSANGHTGIKACELSTERSISHALAMTSFHLSAQQAGQAVFTDKEIPFGEGKAIRPDHQVKTPEGETLLFEMEQDATRAYLPRIMESISNKQAFFQSEAAKPYSREIRILFNLPSGNKYRKTILLWKECFRIFSKENGALSFRPFALPLEEFLKNPEWELSLSNRWQDLSPSNEDKVQESPLNKLTSMPSLYERERSGERDNLVLKALLQEFRAEVLPQVPKPDFGFLDVIYTIYSASHPSKPYPHAKTVIPYESIYLLRRYLEMHPTLTDRLKKTLERGKGHIRWNHVTIAHRMQKVMEDFLAYHGWRNGSPIYIRVVTRNEGWDGPGEFGVTTTLYLQPGISNEWDTRSLSEALSWVLWALFEYAEQIGLVRPEFW